MNSGYKGGNGNGFKLGSLNFNANGIIRKNIAFGNSYAGFNTNSGGGNTIENNTAWNNKGGNFVSYRTSAKDNIWRNNLSYSGEAKMFSDTVQTKNSWNLGIGNPQFLSTSPSSSNFLALASSSPAIDKGTILNLYYVGKAPDLGALEYGQKVSSTLSINLSR
jgi:parallel beta-helix repeat protein